ncbi:hypothetical protein IC007_2180 [Sulfuracidifex tepidarius]|uniref:Uncharacterized protein n=1 Tax=Sulfuracidifex tepidarius TaxID=1294262 RepID=A0A510E548_9CREN|nr:hypothetical protein IC007_2180 [Sulfuracidifex tepidarius]
MILKNETIEGSPNIVNSLFLSVNLYKLYVVNFY